MALSNHLLERLARHVVRKGDLTIHFADGRTARFGDGAEPRAAFSLTDNGAARALALNPVLHLGELYMNGRLKPDGCTLTELLELLLWNTARSGPTRLGRFQEALRLLRRRIDQYNPAPRAKRNVAHHYDLDDGLYDLFLDADKQYSCAYFEQPGMSLEEAQAAKKRHIAQKLLLKPGQRVLDIGSGWGGLALSIAQATPDARVTGVTLSEHQLSISRARAEAAGLSDRVEFRLADYRALEGQFDRIVSVGMLEHVGVGFYQRYFDEVRRLLTPDGVALIHAIGRTGPPRATNPWVAKYIFPGGYIPSLSEVLPRIELAGLVASDIEILRLHYAETLRAWRERFLANRDRAAAIYSDRFCRMWEYYLASSEMAFRTGELIVFQIQLLREAGSAPLTRDYMSAPDTAAAFAASPIGTLPKKSSSK